MMLRKVYEYIKDNEFRFTVYDRKIHIVNYKQIISLKNTCVSIKGTFMILQATTKTIKITT